MTKTMFVTVALTALLELATKKTAVASPSDPLTPAFDKLSAPLQGIAAELSRHGPDAARAEAMRRGVPVDDDGRITVLLRPTRGAAAHIDGAGLAARGARVEATSESWMRVSLPLARLARLGGHPDVAEVTEPATPHADVVEGFGALISEAVALTGADEWQYDGWIGTGVRVAVIDLGFSGLTKAIDAGELPADAVGVDFTGTGLQSGSLHGVGVAEHVVDMAPGVGLYLLKVGDQLDLQNAAAYLREHDIHIANHSVGWVSASYYDDTGPINAIVNDSRELDGVFWVVSSGNSARGHWRGGWLDADSDGWLEFAPGDEGLGLTSASSKICVYLNWNQYGKSFTDLNLVVRKASGAQAASSNGVQGGTGTRRPSESICMSYVAADAPYTLAVKLAAGSTSALDMTLFSNNNNLEHASAASALMDPANARGAFTVGAVKQSVWNNASPTIEPFSGCGPTNDGRMKPELVGPDGTTSFTYGTRNSFGTSFSAPATAGAAALLLARDPSLTPDGLEDALRLAARDTGAVGCDSTFGCGLLELPTPEAPPPVSNSAPVASADKASTIEDTAVTTQVLANDSDADGDALSIASLGAVANGTVVAVGATAVRFTPKANWHGTTSYTYSISDGHGGVATAVVSVTVAAVNDAPVASADLASATAGMAVRIAVLANDVDVDGDALAVRLAAASADGVAVVNSDQTISFTPNGGFSGTTTFSYDAQDASGATSRATVTVAVTGSGTGSAGVLASDTFDSGSAGGGTGWLAGWSFTGYAALTTESAPSSAPWHLRLRSSTGLARRTLAGGGSDLRLVFRAKLSGLELGDKAVVKVSVDGGVTWKVVRTFGDGEDDVIYHTVDLDLSPFVGGSAASLVIAFDADMDSIGDYWYIDDVQVKGVR